MFCSVVGLLGPIETESAEPLGQRFVVGAYHATVAIGAEDLCGVEGGRRDVTHTTSLTAFVFGTMGLGAVLNDIELMFLSDSEQGIHINTLAEKVDG